MVAATRMITEEDAYNSIKKHRGRPTVLETADFVTGVQTGLSYRQAVNMKYAKTGLAVIALVIGDDKTWKMFVPNGKPKYQGVLEQLGRMYESGIFEVKELEDLVPHILNDIENGERSRDIEKNLRRLRQHYKELREHK